MNKRRVGLAVMIAGVLILTAGIISVATSDGESDTALRSTVTTSMTSTTTTTTNAPETTATTAPATTSTTNAPETTATTAPTTTTIDASRAVEEFITQFAINIANADTQSLMATLNPAVALSSGEQLCRDFVNREILAISAYQLVGAIDGPVSKAIDTAAGNITVDNIYIAEVSFDFGGQTFASRSDFVLDPDGMVSWLATCR